MDLKKAGLAAAAVVTVGAGVLGGAAVATASDDGGAVRPGYGAGPGGAPWQHGGPFAQEEVSGDDLAAVTEAVEAYDDTLTVDHVVAREEGGWLVLATTADDARTALTVSADLATVEEVEGPPGPGGSGGPGDGPGGGPADGPEGGPMGGPMGGPGAEVTGDELADVTAAVEAFDPDLTVEHVVQPEDGGDYMVLGTGGDDERTALRVSADLGTVEELDGPPAGGPGGRGGPGDPPGAPDGAPDAPTDAPTDGPAAAPEGAGTST